VIDALLPHLHGGLNVADLLIEIAGLVEEGQLVVQRGVAFQPLEDLDVDLERLVGLVLDLEGAGFLFELGDVQG
jgi:hypothetical protein